MTERAGAARRSVTGWPASRWAPGCVRSRLPGACGRRDRLLALDREHQRQLPETELAGKVRRGRPGHVPAGDLGLTGQDRRLNTRRGDDAAVENHREPVEGRARALTMRVVIEA